jgi:outer membrane protein OmpA-like peptidoglycan-associated protein
VPFKIGVVDAHRDSIAGLHKTIMGLDAQVQYQFYKSTSKVVPYFMAGLGVVTEKDGDLNIQAPLGFGLNFSVAENAYVNYQSEYRLSFSEDRTNLHHAIGFIYLWDKKDLDDEKVVEDEEMDMDSDGDGVMDKLDLCPEEAGIASLNGCPDSDGDGIADFKDKCPNEFGLMATNGCPDSDGDGIADIDDECPNMFGDADLNGCPSKDSDNDGVPDHLDKCPEEKGISANNGCPSEDKDNDGVLDKQDRCPNVPGLVELYGCPDTDGDGIADPDDKCPTEIGPKVYNGCPDTDGDGLDDSIDKCPNSPGPVSSGGCPEIKKADRETLDVAMRSVQFDTGRSTLKSESYQILQQIGGILGRYPDYNLSISGHTDNTGNAAANQSLSEKRAKACYEYLSTQGVSTKRMSHTGYGESRPIADNSTLNGRLLNRRVEFILIPR